MTDDIDRSYDWYLAALNGTRGPIDGDTPKSGFYRTRRSREDKRFIPIAYWYDSNDGGLRCQIDGRNIEDLRAREIWPYASRNPIPETSFWFYTENKRWPEDSETLAKLERADAEDNVSADEKMKRRIQALIGDSKQFESIDSDEKSSLAQGMRNKLNELGLEAEKDGKSLYEPIFREYKRIYGIWDPLAKMAREQAMRLRKAQEDWADQKLQAQRNAERAAVAAIAAAQEQATNSGIEQADGEFVVPQIAARSNLPPPTDKITSGSGGRSAQVGTKLIATIVDIDKVFQHFKADADVIALLGAKAQRAIDAGITIEGITTEEKATVR